MESRWLVRGAVVAVVIGVLAVLLLLGGEEEQEVGTLDGAPGAAEVVTASELRDLASEAGFPVYWAGEIEGADLELTLYEGITARVTYLEAGSEPGPEAEAASLSVSTYSIEDPVAALEEVSGRPGAIVRTSGEGRQVVTSRTSPRSAYFAAPGGDAQVEVYDPRPGRAMALALSDRVRPVG